MDCQGEGNSQLPSPFLFSGFPEKEEVICWMVSQVCRSHLLFSIPGDFTQGTIRILGQQPNGWSKPDEIELSDLTEVQKESFISLVNFFKEKGEPWVATQAWIYLTKDFSSLPEKQAINIVLEAKHDNTGAIQTFPGIVLSEPSYVNLFKSLTE